MLIATDVVGWLRKRVVKRKREKPILYSGVAMNNVTVIRIVAGVLAIVVLVILIFRSKKKAPR